MEAKAPKKLQSLLIDYGAYDRDKEYVYFDRVWHHPDGLRYGAEFVFHFIQRLRQELRLEDPSQLVIVSPDVVRSNFGIIPISVLVAHKIGCYFAVWKELADIRLGHSAIMGTNYAGLDCIVLQDVVSRGHTALRMAHALAQRQWTFRAYVAAVLNSPDGDDPVREILKKLTTVTDIAPEFRYILTVEELK